MRAIVQHGPGDLRLEELPMPELVEQSLKDRTRAGTHMWLHGVSGTGILLVSPPSDVRAER